MPIRRDRRQQAASAKPAKLTMIGAHFSAAKQAAPAAVPLPAAVLPEVRRSKRRWPVHINYFDFRRRSITVSNC